MGSTDNVRLFHEVDFSKEKPVMYNQNRAEVRSGNGGMFISGNYGFNDRPRNEKLEPFLFYKLPYAIVSPDSPRYNAEAHAMLSGLTKLAGYSPLIVDGMSNGMLVSVDGGKVVVMNNNGKHELSLDAILGKGYHLDTEFSLNADIVGSDIYISHGGVERYNPTKSTYNAVVARLRVKEDGSLKMESRTTINDYERIRKKAGFRSKIKFNENLIMFRPDMVVPIGVVLQDGVIDNELQADSLDKYQRNLTNGLIQDCYPVPGSNLIAIVERLVPKVHVHQVSTVEDTVNILTRADNEEGLLKIVDVQGNCQGSLPVLGARTMHAGDTLISTWGFATQPQFFSYSSSTTDLGKLLTELPPDLDKRYLLSSWQEVLKRTQNPV